LENQLNQAKRWEKGPFALGKSPSMVDCVLIPQIYNARRFQISLAGLDRILKIDEACRQHPCFEQAAPENCPDFPLK
jgi:glutathione S-transferase